MQVALIVSSLAAATAAADLACVAEYGLCDTGAPCCNANATCHRFEDNVAQCLPSSHDLVVSHSRAAATAGDKACATTWSQCNGQNWPNGVCCQNAGDECVKHNDYYSQCIPKSTSTTTAKPANVQCSENWSQCNGQNWPHGVCCKDPSFQCNHKSNYVSVCEPKDPKKAAEAACTNVSVQGDATYCVQGAICGDEGDVCPKKGDYAVESCVETLKSYIGATKCVAPMDATCQKLGNGARGCVFGSASTTSAPATTSYPATTKATATTMPATTTASNAGKCSTQWSQCNGQNWPYGVCCEDASFQCNYKNQYLSLCEPKDPKKAVAAADTKEVAVWLQCGGKVYQGATKCAAGTTCNVINDWYSQCQPAPTKEGILATWSRCGGIGYTGPTTCRDEDKCQKFNDYYSQCTPRSA